ncbi:MAG TPA: SDR family NAD(P)-dependent oxidoreductase [Spirochaetota bacterium]|nr:SDR family NAD(P)-dependent oxidoreductase [Spirochaetota bacterium]HOL56311.1 SDR family NAD(P)-dependent oxidoreductase [Spirochaetota bacterium]HPP03344.1 SDR family NAD(P)-dependent oxidoreductase [Spirochaetota bacterium]
MNVLITGGAKRIGKEISLHLSKKGYNIALHFNSSENDALETKSIIEKNGSICKIYRANFSNTDEVINLFSKVKNDFNNIDLLINNASIFERYTLIESDLPFIERIINVNFKAPLLLIKEFAKNFSGNIINIIDAKIFKNDSNYFMYNLTKKSLAEITKMASIEFAPHIRVNAIAPGLIIPTDDQTKKRYENFKIPLNKKGDINNILLTLDFILNNDYITGQIITVDGGFSLI